MFEAIAKLFKPSNTSALEQYITSRNPQSNADVEKFTREYADTNTTTYWGRGL